MEILLKYFPELTEQQTTRFRLLGELYLEWNTKINLISRQDTENLFERHILHSLGIAKTLRFKPMSSVMDLGTGGGFPGLPLAIMFPETKFYLVDSIAKKINVVKDIIEKLELKNALAEQVRAEQVEDEFDFIVTRAVAPVETLEYWTKGKISSNHFHELRNGLLCLKGGDLTEELKATKKKHKIYELSDYFEEEFFQSKKVVYIQMLK